MPHQIREAPPKDPSDVLDYGFRYQRYLEEGEEIASSAWTITPAGELTASNLSATEAVTTLWLSGGVDGRTYHVTNTVTTDNTPPRTYERSFRLTVRQR